MPVVAPPRRGSCPAGFPPPCSHGITGTAPVAILDPCSARGREPSVRPPAAPPPLHGVVEWGQARACQTRGRGACPQLLAGAGPARDPPERVSRLRRGPSTTGGWAGSPSMGRPEKRRDPWRRSPRRTGRGRLAPAAGPVRPASRLRARTESPAQRRSRFSIRAPRGAGSPPSGHPRPPHPGSAR